jgi:gamma-glutamyltranspeptidase/glutathione hydrolase
LQNRGSNFSLQPGHPNAYAPNKRPYHTIIPAIVTNPSDDSLNSVYGVMGGFMQPQGHVQVLLNQFIFGMTPQAALDAPRFCIGAGLPDQGEVMSKDIYLEEGILQEVVTQLIKLGHKASIVSGPSRSVFGRGQIIRSKFEDGQQIYSAGSDPRADGAAFPLI